MLLFILKSIEGEGLLYNMQQYALSLYIIPINILDQLVSSSSAGAITVACIVRNRFVRFMGRQNVHGHRPHVHWRSYTTQRSQPFSVANVAEIEFFQSFVRIFWTNPTSVFRPFRYFTSFERRKNEWIFDLLRMNLPEIRVASTAGHPLTNWLAPVEGLCVR